MREALSELLSILIIVAICSSVVVSYIGSSVLSNIRRPENLSVISAKVSGQTISIHLYNYSERDVTIVSAYVNGQPAPDFEPKTVPKNSMVNVELRIPSGETAPYSFTLKTSENNVVNGVAS
ncbi:MAG: hypothetical protein QXV85_09730 [Candidatus Bathyarchaeia archaeon]